MFILLSSVPDAKARDILILMHVQRLLAQVGEEELKVFISFSLSEKSIK